MIKLILIIIIIFFLSKIIIKEQFYSNDFVNYNECNFYPYGDNKSDCVTKCRYSELKTNYDLYNKCNEKKCEEKCEKCNNEELCPWTNSSDVDSNSDVSNNIDENIILEKTASNENNQIKLEWNVKDDNSIPNKYLIYYKNQTNKAINVIELTTSSTSTSSPTSTTKSSSSHSEEKIFNIVDLDKYNFNKNDIIKNNKYEFIIYGLYNKNKNTNTIKSNKLLVYT